MAHDRESETVAAVVACAATVLGDVSVLEWTPLVSSDRALVARVTLATREGRRSLIAKVPGPAGTGGTREQAALAVLNSLAVPHVPALLAVGENPPLLLLQDAGSGPSLAERLLGQDPAQAAAAVLAWAETVARVQAASLRAGMAFREALTALSPLGAPPVDTTEETTASAAATLARLLPELGVDAPEESLHELCSIGRALSADPDAVEGPWALMPGDTCPDNNLETAAGLVLLDFEWAEYRHVAWEAAYLTVPWPSCWCSWRLPPEITGAALSRWRAVLTPALPGVAAADLDEALERATIAWCFVSIAWLLPQALAGDPPSADPRRRPRPGRRTLIQHRLSVAAEAARSTSPLGHLAQEALHAAQRCWGELELPLAPAWRPVRG